MIKEEVYHLIKIQRIDAAHEKINILLSQEPNNPELLFLKAVCLNFSQSRDEALVLCKEALIQGYDAESCHHLIADILVDKKLFIEAEEQYLMALGLNPQNPDTLADYGVLMFKTGHEKKAFKLIDEALRLEPDNKAALDFYISYHLSNDNKLAHAEVLQRYLICANSELAKLVRIGLSQLVYGNYREAREAFRQAYLMDPTNTDILEVLQDMEVNSNPYFIPINMAEKIGGPKIIWVSFIVIAVILNYLKLDITFFIVLAVYISYAVYTWTTIPVRKYLEKRISKL